MATITSGPPAVYQTAYDALPDRTSQLPFATRGVPLRGTTMGNADIPTFASGGGADQSRPVPSFQPHTRKRVNVGAATYEGLRDDSSQFSHLGVEAPLVAMRSRWTPDLSRAAIGRVPEQPPTDVTISNQAIAGSRLGRIAIASANSYAREAPVSLVTDRPITNNPKTSYIYDPSKVMGTVDSQVDNESFGKVMLFAGYGKSAFVGKQGSVTDEENKVHEVRMDATVPYAVRHSGPTGRGQILARWQN